MELQPQPLDIFNWVRDRLVASHSLELLLDLPLLGSQKLSALLAQMRQLCQTGEETTEFFRATFLHRLLPAHLPSAGGRPSLAGGGLGRQSGHLDGTP